MTDRPDRCPSCSGTLTPPRPAACPWCGGVLAAIPASEPASRPAPGPARYGDARDLPRELPPAPTPVRGGCFVIALVLAVLFAGAVVFFGVHRVEPDAPPPPDAPKQR